MSIHVEHVLKERDIMPRFDGTGPDGRGPRTGRGMGRCCDESRGCGWMRRGYSGFRRGLRRYFAGPEGCPMMQQPSVEERIADLKEYKKQLSAEIEALEKEQTNKNG